MNTQTCTSPLKKQCWTYLITKAHAGQASASLLCLPVFRRPMRRSMYFAVSFEAPHTPQTLPASLLAYQPKSTAWVQSPQTCCNQSCTSTILPYSCKRVQVGHIQWSLNTANPAIGGHSKPGSLGFHPWLFTCSFPGISGFQAAQIHAQPHSHRATSLPLDRAASSPGLTCCPVACRPSEADRGERTHPAQHAKLPTNLCDGGIQHHKTPPGFQTKQDCNQPSLFSGSKAASTSSWDSSMQRCAAACYLLDLAGFLCAWWWQALHCPEALPLTLGQPSCPGSTPSPHSCTAKACKAHRQLSYTAANEDNAF